MQALRNLILVLALALPTLPAQAGSYQDDPGYQAFMAMLNFMREIRREDGQHQRPRQQHDYKSFGYPYLTMPNSTTYLQLNASKKIRVRTTRDGHHYVRLKDLPYNAYCYVIGGHIGWYDRNERDECYIHLNRFTWGR